MYSSAALEMPVSASIVKDSGTDIQQVSTTSGKCNSKHKTCLDVVKMC